MAPPATFEFVSVNSTDAARRRLDPDAMFRVRRQAMVVAYRAREKSALHITAKEVSSPKTSYETHRFAMELGNPADAKIKQLTRRRKKKKQQGRDEEQQDEFYETLLSPTYNVSSKSSKDYQALRNEFGVDIIHLGILSELDVGLFAFDSINRRPERIAELMSQGHPESWLRQLPSHYGYCNYLDDAIRCVTARLAQRLSGSVSQATVINLYLKALRSLQSAIESPGGWMNTNVLYASHLLAIFELLDAENKCPTQAWERHKSGLVRLLSSRPPEHYSTAFDRAILRAQAMTVPVESLVDPSRQCFFSNARWKHTFAEFATLETNPTEAKWWTLFGVVCELPGLFQAVSAFVGNGMRAEEFPAVFQRAKNLRKALLDWLDDFMDVDSSLKSSSWVDIPIVLNDRQCLLPTNLRSIFSLHALATDKILSVLTPDPDEAAELLLEVQGLEQQWMTIEHTARQMYPALPATMQWYMEPKVASDTAFSGLKNYWTNMFQPPPERPSGVPEHEYFNSPNSESDSLQLERECMQSEVG